MTAAEIISICLGLLSICLVILFEIIIPHFQKMKSISNFIKFLNDIFEISKNEKLTENINYIGLTEIMSNIKFKKNNRFLYLFFKFINKENLNEADVKFYYREIISEIKKENFFHKWYINKKIKNL